VRQILVFDVRTLGKPGRFLKDDMALFCIKTDSSGARGKKRNGIILRVTGKNVTAAYLLRFLYTNLTK
jgi:hypothetical protein